MVLLCMIVGSVILSRMRVVGSGWIPRDHCSTDNIKPNQTKNANIGLMLAPKTLFPHFQVHFFSCTVKFIHMVVTNIVLMLTPRSFNTMVVTSICMNDCYCTFENGS